MVSLTGISLFIIALSFALIAIYVVKTLKAASGTMSSVSTTLEKFEGQMQGITTESEALLKRTNRITEDIEHKTQSLNGFVDMINNVGSTVGHVNTSLQGMAESVAHESGKDNEQVTKAMKWGDAAIELYLKWKTKKARSGRKE